MRTRARTWELLPVVLLMALVGLRAWQELSLFLLVADAPVAAVARLPLVLFWAPSAVALLGTGLVAVLAALRGGDARRVRVLYLVAFLVLVVDILFLPATRLPPIVTSDLLAQSTLEQARARVILGGGPGLLPAQKGPIEAALAESKIKPQYLVDGEPLGHWNVILVPDCSAPILEVGSHGVGTVFYCLSSDRREGSLTVVGTGGALVGPPAMAWDGEGPVIVPLSALLPADGDPEDLPSPGEAN